MDAQTRVLDTPPSPRSSSASCDCGGDARQRAAAAPGKDLQRVLTGLAADFRSSASSTTVGSVSGVARATLTEERAGHRDGHASRGQWCLRPQRSAG